MYWARRREGIASDMIGGQVGWHRYGGSASGVTGISGRVAGGIRRWGLGPGRYFARQADNGDLNEVPVAAGRLDCNCPNIGPEQELKSEVAGRDCADHTGDPHGPDVGVPRDIHGQADLSALPVDPHGYGNIGYGRAGSWRGQGGRWVGVDVCRAAGVRHRTVFQPDAARPEAWCATHGI
jgi:hypothetical protein